MKSNPEEDLWLLFLSCFRAFRLVALGIISTYELVLAIPSA